MVYGQGLWVNVGEGLSFLKEAAEEGITRAAFELGNFYSKGTAVEQDIEAAIRWYEKAALSWFLKSAKADYARAQAHIG